MSFSIAIPNNPVYSKLFENKKEVAEKYGIKIYDLDESKCCDMFANNLVKAAFINPLGFGQGLAVADYRIIPSNVLALYGYTGLASIFFKNNTISLKTCASPNPDDFIIRMGNVILSERYDINAELVKCQGEKTDILSKHDAAILWQSCALSDNALDISELWSDSYEMPILLGFWVCRSEEYPENIKEIVSELADRSLPSELDSIDEGMNLPNHPPREGKYFYKWNADIEYTLDQTLQLLYFRKFLPEIPAVKVFGRD